MARRKKRKRNFEFVGPGRKRHTFAGRTPREAAKKVATRFGTKGTAGKKIELREKGRRNKDGTYSIHQYKVGYKIVKPPPEAPGWLGSKAKKPIVKKIGIKRVRKIRK